jgi:hypothetical protein
MTYRDLPIDNRSKEFDFDASAELELLDRLRSRVSELFQDREGNERQTYRVGKKRILDEENKLLSRKPRFTTKLVVETMRASMSVASLSNWRC